MATTVQSCLVTGVILAGLNTVPAAPAAIPGHLSIRLTGIDTAATPLGDGVALVVGPSGIPIPPPGYLDAVERLYLAPRGFTGTVQAVNTPEALYPITGVKSLPFDTAAAQGQQILDTAVLQRIADGHVDAANPVVVFGYSQSSVISAQLMQQLADQGVPSDDVHFVLVADESVPNGGSLSSFDIPVGDHPSAPALGITFSGAQPSDLYPTDVYTLEYDGFADFPRYPIDELSTLNALLGIIFQHVTYADLTPEQIHDAIALPTSTVDTLTDYYAIRDPYLPLLQPLLVVPILGKPLYDLLEPDLRILVNLGYGSITDGWNQGPADTATPIGFLPTDIDPAQLLTALSDGAQRGFTDAVADLAAPDSYRIANIIADPGSSPALVGLVSGAETFGLVDTANPSLLDFLKAFLGGFAHFPISDATLASPPTEIIDALTGTVAADYATVLPIADTVDALLTSLPTAAVDYVISQLQDGDLLGGLTTGIGVLAGLIPFTLAFGVIPPVAEALGGTLVNLVDLFDVVPGS